MNETVNQGVLGALGINWQMLLAQLVNFAIIVLVLWRWAYRPLLKIMNDREKKIRQGLRDAEQSKKALAEAEDKQESILQSARIEAHDLIEEAKKDADKERQNIKSATQKDIEKQLADARDRLRQDKDAMFDSLKKEVADLVMLTTEKVTKSAGDPKVQRQLIDQAIGELDKESGEVKK